MEKIFCDGCQKEIDDKEYASYLRPYRDYSEKRKKPFYNYDLCESCTEKMLGVLTNNSKVVSPTKEAKK